MVWLNGDGLLVRFPGDSLGDVPGGEYPGAGANRVIELEVNAASLTTTPTAFGAPYLIVPRNSVIESVEVISETALSGGTGTAVDIGLKRLDGTEIDHDGLVDGILVANLNVAGEKNVYTAGVSLAGVLVGTETAYPGHISVQSVTGPFTAGRLVIRVNIYVKDVDQNPGQF